MFQAAHKVPGLCSTLFHGGLLCVDKGGQGPALAPSVHG